jgi:predicted NUDIX family NTP pyrophosphohydrolase
MPTTPTTSAGILLFRLRDGTLEVLLGHMGGPFWARRDEAAWSIVKGEHDPSEEPFDAARREWREETGLRQAGGKRVRAWAVEGDLDPATVRSGMFELEWPPRSGRTQAFPELDRAAWFDVPTARTKVVRGQVPFLDVLERELLGAGAPPPPP